MKTYKVKVRRVLELTAIVPAKNAEDAGRKAHFEHYYDRIVESQCISSECLMAAIAGEGNGESST